MGEKTLTAREAVSRIEKYLENNFKKLTTNDGKAASPETKKEWNKVLMSKDRMINNVEDGAVLAGELHTKLRSCLSWLQSVVKENEALQNEINQIKTEFQSKSTVRSDLEQFKDTLKNEIVSEVATLIAKSQNVDTPSQVRKQTNNGKKSQLYATVVKIKQDSEMTTEQSYANIAKELKGSSVEFLSRKEKSKSVVVGFASEEKRKSFEEKLAADSNTSKSFDISRPKKMNPKIAISIGLHSFDGLSVNCDKNEELREFIKNDIMERNSFLADPDFNDDIFKLVYMSKQRNETLVVFRVTPAIREKIRLNGNVLYCGHSRIWVKDWYHVIQCFKCQKIGHRSINDECKSETSTCMYCAGKHQSKNCEHKKNAALKKCANCATSSNTAFKAAATTHNSADFSCPYIQAEIRRLKRNTLEADQKN